MNMKEHILAALKEEFNRWEGVLASLSEVQTIAPHHPSYWSTKDELAHLWAWQQRSIARVQAAQLDKAPEFPIWPADMDPESDGDTERVNQWIYDTNREYPWSKVYENWSKGFRQLLASAEAVSERDLLDAGRFPWLQGYPLALILLATYDHHQEHLERLLDWIHE